MKKRKIFIVCTLSGLLIIVLLACNITNLLKVPSETSGYFTYRFIDKQAILVKVDSEITGQLVIPSTHEGYPVTGIGWPAFENCSNITEVIIPDSITTIQDYRVFAYADAIKVEEENPAFCSDEKGVLFSKDKTELLKAPRALEGTYRIPGAVTKIGEGAFDRCTALTDIIIPDSVTEIDDGAFDRCTALTEVTIPDSVTSIGYHAFCRCENLERVAMGSGVRTIGKTAFSACSKLTSITLPDGLESIGEGAFQMCQELESIVIPDSVTEIGSGAFHSCYSLANITLGKGIDTIAECTFFDCAALSHITIPDTVTKIEHDAFCRSGLVSVVIPNSVTYIDSGFYKCAKLTSVTIGSEVETFDLFAFAGCNHIQSLIIADGATKIDSKTIDTIGCRDTLTEVTIPDSVTRIGINAFYKCANLSQITIPKTVTRIENLAFVGCEGLNTIHYTGTTEEWEKMYFGMDWNRGVPATEVVCANGTVSLK